ncbi:hypothetical protein Hgul01_01445 [Herpetosiphon gulosus]|uniref:Uncharacterized protein n=1 Tax=Herpetosiphon gulosus TaxID=1973496 RepID=A0ABP9WWY1_9CHLR
MRDEIQTPLARPSHFVPLATPSDKAEDLGAEQ